LVVDVLTLANGTYTLNVPEDTYDISATKYGYSEDNKTGVLVTEGSTTTVNFVITPLSATTVSGYVYDGGVEGLGSHGYPLYSSIHVSTPGFDETIYADPFTGYYEIELIEDTPHTFTTDPIPGGYDPLVEVVTATGTEYTHDIYVPVDAACSAPGYIASGVIEHFETGRLPSGWVNYDYAGSGQVWQFNDPGGRGNLTPGGEGGFAILDSDAYGSEYTQDAGLRTPLMDFSGEASVILDFDTDYSTWNGSSSTVRVSADSGATWSLVWSYTDSDFNGHVTLDISAQAAGEANVIIEFRYTGDWAWWWEIDDVMISPLDCQLEQGGVVAGYVYDANDNSPIVAADVYSDVVETQAFFIPEDPASEGLFWVFHPTTTDPEDVVFTASKDLYGSDVQTVSIDQDAINQQDFYLGTGELSFDPTSMEVTMDMGDAPMTKTLTISNLGTSEAMFELVEKDEGFVLPEVMVPAFKGELPQDSRPVSMGRALEAANLSALSASGDNPFNGLLAGEPAFAVDAYPGENLVYIPDTTLPGTWTIVGGVPGTEFFAGDFVGGDFSHLYIVNYTGNSLYSVNTATAAYTLIGTTTPPAGQTFSGLTGTPDGTMYGLTTTCTASNLVIVDIATAATTDLGALPGIGCGIDLAYNTDDDMIYIVDLITDSLFKVDPATMTVTEVGSLGVAANYAQGMDYEEESGVLYWAAYTTTGELRIIDTTTGASALVGAFPGGAEVDSLAFATGGQSDVPWLSEDPISGTVPAGDWIDVDVTFDPTGLSQPGDYLAALKVKHDTPYTYPNIPVVLHLIAPEGIYLPLIIR